MIQVVTNAQEVAAACLRYAAALPGVVRGALELWSMMARDGVSNAAPVRTGVLKASIQYGATGTGTEPDCFIATPVDYAAAVEFGAEEHEILPKNKMALRFPASGGHGDGEGWQFAASVQHPGNEAQPFFFPTIESFLPQMNPLTDDAVTRLGDACFRFDGQV
jgi:hypothetical protein